MNEDSRRYSLARAVVPGVLASLVSMLAATSSRAQAPAPSSAPPATPPAARQESAAQAGPFSIALEVSEEFLGRSGEKTVVRFRLLVDRAQLRKAGQLLPRVYQLFVAGSLTPLTPSTPLTPLTPLTPVGSPDPVRIPIEVDLSDTSKPVTLTFLRAVSPGTVRAELRLEGETGTGLALKAFTFEVPRQETEFRAADAGVDSQGLPAAAAIILESENDEAAGAAGKAYVKIQPPPREVPVGLLRIGCDVEPPVTRVEFYLEDKKILTKNRPPYEIDLDLGKIPRRQTLKAIGYDRTGRFVDADAWTLNEKDARLVVRLLELPSSAKGTVEAKVTVQSIAGGVAKGVQLYADDVRLAAWSKPPYVASISAGKLKGATLLRATAFDEDGREYSDLRMLHGAAAGVVASVEVHDVEIHASVLDESGRFVKDLPQETFVVREDGAVQVLQGFGFAQNLTITLGIVIDGSGSMEKTMPLVRQAAGGFVERLLREKDQGFVMEFRERPILLAALTKNVSTLASAVAQASAQGGTALYDSIVMALYQYRAVPGRKALVVLSDGKDNRSWTDYDTLRRYARSAHVPVYLIGMGFSITDFSVKSKLKDLCADTGGHTFFVDKAEELKAIYARIEEEIRSQYLLTYRTLSKKPETEFRQVAVEVKRPGVTIRTIRGFYP